MCDILNIKRLNVHYIEHWYDTCIQFGQDQKKRPAPKDRPKHMQG